MSGTRIEASTRSSMTILPTGSMILRVMELTLASSGGEPSR